MFFFTESDYDDAMVFTFKSLYMLFILTSFVFFIAYFIDAERLNYLGNGKETIVYSFAGISAVLVVSQFCYDYFNKYYRIVRIQTKETESEKDQRFKKEELNKIRKIKIIPVI